MNQTITPVINGVDTSRLFETMRAVQADPTIACFQFRARNRWMEGGHNCSTIQDFYGAGQEDTNRTQPFMLTADEPPVLLGQDCGPNPVEFVLHALAACLTTSMVYHAAARGIQIDSVTSTFTGDLDLRGFLGLDSSIRKGYQGIRVRFDVTSNASPEMLAELMEYSPVRDIVSNPVPVSIEVCTTPVKEMAQ